MLYVSMCKLYFEISIIANFLLHLPEDKSIMQFIDVLKKTKIQRQCTWGTDSTFCVLWSLNRDKARVFACLVGQPRH